MHTVPSQAFTLQKRASLSFQLPCVHAKNALFLTTCLKPSICVNKGHLLVRMIGKDNLSLRHCWCLGEMRRPLPLKNSYSGETAQAPLWRCCPRARNDGLCWWMSKWHLSIRTVGKDNTSLRLCCRWYSAKKSAYVTRAYLPHGLAVRLHAHNSVVIILTPETAGSICVWAVAHPCR